MMIPIGGIFFAEKGTVGRRNLTYVTIGLGILAGLALVTDKSIFFVIFVLGILAYSFLASYIIGKGARTL